MKPAILYVFGGEKAQGAEIVIERLMDYNSNNAVNHLFISPGNFATALVDSGKPYKISIIDHLRKLNRNKGGRISYFWNALKNYFAISYRVYSYIKAHRIDFIHANTIVPASYLLPLILYSKLFLRSKKWLWSDHDIRYYGRLDFFLSRLCASLYDQTLTVSKAVKAKYPGNDKIKLLYNGLDPGKFMANVQERKVFRAELNLPANAIILGMPAVVHPRKGQLELINAFNPLANNFLNIFLLLSGGFEEATPDYSARVINAIAKNDRIRHIGFVKNMPAFYNGCDIIVNNSDITGSEPLGTTIYEGMACEKVVVASATGGTPEIIDNEIDGLLFSPDDRDDLERKLRFAIEAMNGLFTLKKAAREKVLKKFDIDIMVKNYNQLLAG